MSLESYNQDIEIQDNSEDEEEIDLIELLLHFRSKLKWIVGGFLVCAGLAALITIFLITPKYTATSKMYMVSASSKSVVDLTDLNIGQSVSNDYVELLKTRPIIEDVIMDQHLTYTYDDLVDMLEISVIQDTRIIQIDATSTDKREAMNIANALADKAVKELPKLMETPEPHIAEYAIVPVNKSSPSLTKNTMIGGLIGLLIMLALFTLEFLLDDTYKTAEDIQKDFGVMPLTVIPEGKIDGFEDADDQAGRGLFRRSSRRKSRREYKGKNKKQ